MTWRLAGIGDPYVPYRVLALVGSNVDLARTLLQRFIDDIPRAWRVVEDAVAAGEPSAVAQSVHSLAGSLQFVEADHLTGRITAWARDDTGGVTSVSPAELIAGREALAVLLARMFDYLQRSERGPVLQRSVMRRRQPHDGIADSRREASATGLPDRFGARVL